MKRKTFLSSIVTLLAGTAVGLPPIRMVDDKKPSKKDKIAWIKHLSMTHDKYIKCKPEEQSFLFAMNEDVYIVYDYRGLCNPKYTFGISKHSISPADRQDNANSLMNKYENIEDAPDYIVDIAFEVLQKAYKG